MVIGFDGTWKRAQDADVSNVEKIARTVVGADAAGVQQVVWYQDGVGTSYKVDRILGGALGLGLSANLMNAYRWLALNYSPGDQVYIFGFSRGAFTARSLVGMLDTVGLVRADRLINRSLKTAEERYRLRLNKGSDKADTAAEFRRDFSHAHVCVPFVGVFDTVEALGPRAKFHRVDFLNDVVAVGRQALAIDERRRQFWPRLWTGEKGLAESGRVRQVWFEGYHSDVGGGVTDTGLPDTTLLWMAAEASRQGLVFDNELLVDYLNSGSEARRHDSMNLGYRLSNLFMRAPTVASRAAFSRSWRVLEPDNSVGVQISSSALDHYREGTYSRSNLERWLESQPQSELPRVTEKVLAFPELDGSEIREVLRGAVEEATDAGGAVHGCPSLAHHT